MEGSWAVCRGVPRNQGALGRRAGMAWGPFALQHPLCCGVVHGPVRFFDKILSESLQRYRKVVTRLVGSDNVSTQSLCQSESIWAYDSDLFDRTALTWHQHTLAASPGAWHLALSQDKHSVGQPL